jgi:tetratricopeptide (TPR) repeat protein
MKKQIFKLSIASLLIAFFLQNGNAWAQGGSSFEWDVNASSAQNHWNKGIFHLSRGTENDLSYARQEFAFIVGMKDDQGLKPNAHLHLGVVSFLEGNYQEALKSYQNALDLKPDYAEAYFNMGTVYYKVNLSKKAEESFLKAISLDPAYGRAHYSLGFLYLEQKRYDLAKQHAEKAAEHGVPFKTLKEKLAKVAR